MRGRTPFTLSQITESHVSRSSTTPRWFHGFAFGVSAALRPCPAVQIQNAVMQIDGTGEMTSEEASRLIWKGLQGGSIRQKDLTVTKVMSMLRTRGSLLTKKGSGLEHDDPLVTGRKPGDGITKTESANSSLASERSATEATWIRGTKKAVSKTASAANIFKVTKELKNLSPAFHAAVAAIKEIVS